MTTPNCNEDHQGNRYIALIDILGFRSLLNTTPLAEIVRKVEVLLEDSQRYLGSNRRTLGEVHFSDTILIWTPLVKDQESGFSASAHLYFAVTDLIYRSFMAGIHLRAGIGFGQCFIDTDRHIFIGPAIVDAYLTESAQDWIGGALHPSVPIGFPQGPLISYPVPTKVNSTTQFQMALNWPDCPTSPAEYRSLKLKVDQALGAVAPSHVGAKFKNTLIFVSTILSKVKLKRITSEGSSAWFNPIDANLEGN